MLRAESELGILWLEDTMVTAAPPTVGAPSLLDAKLAQSKVGKLGSWIFLIALVVGIFYAGSHLASDLSGVRTTSIYPYLLLGLALAIALAFEFVNGFHDTANAVA